MLREGKAAKNMPSVPPLVNDPGGSFLFPLTTLSPLVFSVPSLPFLAFNSPLALFSLTLTTPCASIFTKARFYDAFFKVNE